MRRLVIIEPTVRPALWCRHLVLFGAALAVLAVLSSRTHLVEPSGAIAVLAAALGCTALGVAMAPIAAAMIWQTGRPGIGAMLTGLALAGMIFAYPVFLVVRSRHAPALADVVTDSTLPIAFSDAPAALAARGNARYPVPSTAALERAAAAYPDVRPLTLDASPADVERAALRLVRKHRWTVVESVRPAGTPVVGQIQAVAYTPVMGFPEDVVIRIAAAESGGTRVDMRSASRWGSRDLGSNARRIESFLSELEDATDEQ